MGILSALSFVRTAAGGAVTAATGVPIWAWCGIGAIAALGATAVYEHHAGYAEAETEFKAAQAEALTKQAAEFEKKLAANNEAAVARAKQWAAATDAMADKNKKLSLLIAAERINPLCDTSQEVLDAQNDLINEANKRMSQ